MMVTKKSILSTIRRHRTNLQELGVQSVALFGSYVRNEQTNKSDIDILIDFNPGQENFDNYMAVSDYLIRMFRGKKVEIVTKNGLSPYIGPGILKEAIYV